MKVFVVLLLFFMLNVSHSLISSAIPGIVGGMAKDKGFFSSITSIFSDNILKEITVVTEEDMNDRGALKMHIVVIFEKEEGDAKVLYSELSKMSASQYFSSIKQLLKDHPDKMVIRELELIAEKRVIPPISIQSAENMNAIAILIFADYSSSGEHRAQLSIDGKAKIICKKRDFECEELD